MLDRRQCIVLVVFAVLFWAGATAWIRLVPASLQDSLRGDLGFLTSIPVCWLCILLVRDRARLSAAQLIPGAALVVAVATLIDASALRWAPVLYGTDDHGLRLGAAWLLWGYGLTLAIAFAMQARHTKSLQFGSQSR